jgi:hypothetical protein
MTFTFTAVVKATAAKFNFAACSRHAKCSFRVRLHTKYLVGLVWSVLCEEGCFDDTCGDVLCLSYTYTVTDTVLLENSRFIWPSKFYI